KGFLAFRRRAPADRDRKGFGRGSVVPFVGRALCRSRPHRRGRDPGHHCAPQVPGTRHPDHRPQRKGDARDHRPGLYHAPGKDLGLGSGQSGGPKRDRPQVLPWRGVYSVRWGPTLLDRYIVREMLGPLFFGIAAFTSLFVSGDLLSLANTVVELGAPIEPALRVFLLKLPQIIVWTLPMSVLLATLLALSRLSANSEIVAMRAGGTSFFRIAAPILVISLIVSIISFVVNETIVPETNAESRRILVEEVRGGTLPTVTRHVVIKGERGNDLDWMLYANRYDGRTSTFHQATLVYMANNEPVQTAFADRIVWQNDRWVMENGVAYHFSRDGNVVVATYPAHTRPVELGQTPQQVARLQKRPEEMGLAELKAHIEVLNAQGA